MKLSIVIPAYNEEAGIAECLKNTLPLLSTDLKGSPRPVGQEIEIIVVNNASTDRTGEIARSFAEVKVVDEPNKGLVRARHSGFINSTGDLIANVDADSRIPAGWIERIFNEFEKKPNLVALSGPYIYYDLPGWFNWASKIYYALGLAATYFNLNKARRGAMLQGGNFILRRTALEKIGGYRFEKFDFYGEETDVAMRICEVGPIKFTFKLPMITSGRRMSKEGILRVATRYAVNYFWTILFGRPYTKQNIDIRVSK
ncbi:MAG: glycosyltransferase family 2 protein [Candidatus Paceibacterota bacterium]|jgi:glycosyltransferase involved in cell wall biosynthesis